MQKNSSKDIIGFFKRKEDGRISVLVPGVEEPKPNDDQRLVDLTVDTLYNSKEFFNLVATIVDLCLDEKIRKVEQK